MNLNDGIEEAAKDVDLASEYFDQCICTSFHCDSGAGVNASSSQRTFLAGVDPLSELVWSPRQGLCFRCADGTSSMEKTYLKWHSEPTNKKLNSAKVGTISMPIAEEGVTNAPFLYLAEERTPLELTHDTEESGDYQEQEIKSFPGLFNLSEKNDLASCGREDVRGTYISCTNAIDVNEGDTNKPKRTYRSYLDMNGLVEGKKGTHAYFKKKSKSDTDHFRIRVSSRRSYFSCPTRILVESKTGTEENVICGRRISEVPGRARSPMQKFKGKSTVDGENSAKKRLVCEKDGSHESVESCSRNDFVNVFEAKKQKMSIQNLPSSSSYCGKASSFIMWVSNMVKGYPQLEDNPRSNWDKTSESSTFHSFFGIPSSPERNTLQPSNEKAVICDSQDKKIDSNIDSARSLHRRNDTNPKRQVHDMVIENSNPNRALSLRRKTDRGQLCVLEADHCNSLMHRHLNSKPLAQFSQRNVCDASNSNCGDQILSLLHTTLDVNTQCVPKHVLEGMKSLQISRADVFKWIQSEKPLSDFDGFFLRLRLTNVGGLGCVKYYVAKIAGNLRRASENKVLFAVELEGKITLIEHQYISNKRFLEDELVGWWSSTTLRGGEVPSAAELRLKFDQRKRFDL